MSKSTKSEHMQQRPSVTHLGDPDGHTSGTESAEAAGTRRELRASRWWRTGCIAEGTDAPKDTRPAERGPTGQARWGGQRRP